MHGRALVAAAALVVLPAAAAMSPASAESEICVAVVVDYQQLAGAPGAPSRHCAKVPNRSTGYEILLERARTLGRPAPRSESGLVCAIDGLPERGCGESGGGGYRYWAYFHRTGDGSWQYSNRGAADYRVIDDPSRSTDDRPSEGWVWVEGGAEGSVRPAAIPYDEVCPPTPKTPASPTPRPSAGAATAPARSATPTPRASRSAGPAGATSGRTPAAAAGAPEPAATLANPSLDEPPRPASARPDGTAVPLAAAGSSTPPAGNAVELLGDAPGDGSSGLPVSTIAGIGVLALLGGAVVIRLRRADRG